MLDLDLSYAYNGALCCILRLVKTECGAINMMNDYGELMFTVYSGVELYRKMQKLSEDDYA